MTRTILASLVSVYIGVIGVLIVYNFQTPREWTLAVLSQKEGVDIKVPKETHSASVLSGILTSEKNPFLQSATQPAFDAAVQNSEPATTTPTTYQFKTLVQVDQCTLNKLGAQGWHPIQFGGSLVVTSGFDEVCKKPGLYQSLDWVLMEKVSGGQ